MDRRDFVLTTLLGLVSRPLAFVYERLRGHTPKLPSLPKKPEAPITKVPEPRHRRHPAAWYQGPNIIFPRD